MFVLRVDFCVLFWFDALKIKFVKGLFSCSSLRWLKPILSYVFMAPGVIVLNDTCSYICVSDVIELA